MNGTSSSDQRSNQHLSEDSAYLDFHLLDPSMLLLLIPIFMLFLFFEHKKELKKFKKIWKEKLDTSLVTLKEVHRKRIDEFKVQPYAMKAEWGTIKTDVEKRLEDLRNLKINVNVQLTGLKLDFQTQISRLMHGSEISQPTMNSPSIDFQKSQQSYVDSKLTTAIASMEEQLLGVKQYVDEQFKASELRSTQKTAEAIKLIESHMNSFETNLKGMWEIKMQNGQCD